MHRRYYQRAKVVMSYVINFFLNFKWMDGMKNNTPTDGQGLSVILYMMSTMLDCTRYQHLLSDITAACLAQHLETFKLEPEPGKHNLVLLHTIKLPHIGELLALSVVVGE